MRTNINKNEIVLFILFLVCIGLLILFTKINEIIIYEGVIKWYHILEAIISIPILAFMFFYPLYYLKYILIKLDLYSEKIGEIGFITWFVLFGIYYGVFLTN